MHNITLAHLPNSILKINHKPALNILFEQVVNIMSLDRFIFYLILTFKSHFALSMLVSL